MLIRIILLAGVVLWLTSCGGDQSPSDSGESGGASDALPPSSQAQGSDDTHYPFHGRWALSETNCALNAGVSENAPVQIDARAVTGFAGGCAIGRVIVLEGEGRYDAILECLPDGQGGTETIDLRLSGDLLLAQTSMETVTLTRCPEAE